MNRRWWSLSLTLSLLLQQGHFVSEAFAQALAASVRAGTPIVPVTTAGVGSAPLTLAAPLAHSALTLGPSLKLPAPALQIPVAAKGTPASAAIALPAAAQAVARPLLAAPARAGGISAIKAAEPKPDAAASPSPATASEKLEDLGRGIRSPVQTAALTQAFDGASLKIFLTQHGQEPVAVDMASLRGRLASDPAYAKALNAAGRVRLVLGGILTEAGAAEVKTLLAEQGISAPVVVERIPLVAPKEEPRAGEMKAARGGWLVRVLTAPVREAAYLARTFAASATKPTRGEIVGGVVSKGPAFVLSAIWWAKLFLPVHPVAFAAALGFSFALQAFHGVWINTWQNFQNIIGRQRGMTYQTIFNFLYMQSTAAAFRMISYAVIAGTVAPWQLAYWRDMGIATVLGTYFGTLGYHGVNALYDKGRVSRSTRSIIQQGRDLFFLLAGTFFASGSMTAFWVLFVIQQSLDISLYLLGRMLKARPVAVVADAAVADAAEFKAMYAVTPPEVKK